MPSRFAVIPRRGSGDDIQWFEADPTYVLHFTNAYEDGDEIVLDGFFQGDPGADRQRPRATSGSAHSGSSPSTGMQARLHRWRFNLVTGGVREEQLVRQHHRVRHDQLRLRGPRRTATPTPRPGKPGWFLFDGLVKHDLKTGAEERFAFDDGVYGSETAMAPRVGSTGEDDGYLVTITTDMNADASYCLVFDAARVARRPGLQTATARTGFQRHPLDVGGRLGVATLAADR